MMFALPLFSWGFLRKNSQTGNSPEKSQTERFNKKVAELSDKGYGCHQIGRLVGSGSTTALRANRKKKMARRNFAVRKGMKKTDWDSLDKQSVENVRRTCEQIYHGEHDNGRPHKVSQFAVTKAMEWPDKRLRYLPKCQDVVDEYQETQQEYWAREIEWAIEQLKKEESLSR